jgi:DinB family protein
MIAQSEVDALIDCFAGAPTRLRAAWEKVPAAARQWRPAAGKWSAHEIVLHCADAQTVSVTRLLYVLAENDPLIVAYDQDAWARNLDYHAHPIEPALAMIEAVHGYAVPLLRRQPPEAWSRAGRHTEVGRYAAEGWLRSYAEHVDTHVGQIERNVAAFASRG